MKQLSTQKKLLLILGAVVLIIACIFTILLATAESAVVGEWRRQEAFRSDVYGLIYSIYILTDDGTFVNTVVSATNGNVLKTDYGVWSISGFEVHTESSGGIRVDFTYNPITGILNNGGFWVQGSDVPFIRIG